MSESPEHRLPFAVAMEWASRVTTISLEMALPPAIGHWLDLRFDSSPALLAMGGMLGFGTGMLHLMRIAQASKKKGRRGRRAGPPPPDDESSGQSNEDAAQDR